MLKRTITGLFIVLVLAGFTWLREVSVLFFDALTLVLIYGAIVELAFALKLFNRKFFVTLLFAYPIALACIYIFSGSVLQAIALQILCMLVIFVLCMFKEIIVLGIKRKNNDTEEDERERNSGLLNETVGTLGLCVYPISLIGALFGINHFGLNLGYIGIILVFGISMCTDTFAYLFGSMIKGTKLAPEISPKKSVSGFVFGALGGIGVSLLCMYLFYFKGLLPSAILNLSTLQAVIMFVSLGVIGTFATQFGDLVASTIKRKTGIKDFGSIFPGHGGFMDRIDGAMFTSLLVFIVFALFLV